MPNSLTPLISSLFKDDTFSGLEGTKRYWSGPFDKCKPNEDKTERSGKHLLEDAEIEALRAGESIYLGSNIPIVPQNAMPPLEVSRVLFHVAKTALAFKSDYHTPMRESCAAQVLSVLQQCGRLEHLGIDFAPLRALPSFEAMAQSLPALPALTSLEVTTRPTQATFPSRGLLFGRGIAPPTIKAEDFPTFSFAALRPATALQSVKIAHFCYTAEPKLPAHLPRRFVTGNLVKLELSGLFGPDSLGAVGHHMDLSGLRELYLENRVFSGGEKALRDATETLLKTFWRSPHNNLVALSLKNFDLWSDPELPAVFAHLDNLFPRLETLVLVNHHRWHAGVHFTPATLAPIHHQRLRSVTLEEGMAPPIADFELKHLPALKALTLKYMPHADDSSRPEMPEHDHHPLFDGTSGQLDRLELLGSIALRIAELEKLSHMEGDKLPKHVVFQVEPRASIEQLVELKKTLHARSAAWLAEGLDKALSEAQKRKKHELFGRRKEQQSEKSAAALPHEPGQGSWYPPRPKPSF